MRDQIAAWMIGEIHTHHRRSRAELIAAVPAELGPVDEFDGRTLQIFRNLHAGQIRWVSAGQYWESLRA